MFAHFFFKFEYFIFNKFEQFVNGVFHKAKYDTLDD